MSLLFFVFFFFSTVVTSLVMVKQASRGSLRGGFSFTLLWFIYFALDRNYGEQSQRMGAIRLMDNALFCIFSCIFFCSAGLLVVGEMSIWFHWVCLFVRDGFHLYSFFGTCFLRSSFYSSFCYFNFGIHCRLSVSFLGFGFICFLYLFTWVEGFCPPNMKSFPSLTNSSHFFLPITSSPSLLN